MRNKKFVIIHAVTKWWPYLLGHSKVCTDHGSLKYLLEKRIVTRSRKGKFQIRWDMITRLCIERGLPILRPILYLGNLKQKVQSWPYLSLWLVAWQIEERMGRMGRDYWIVTSDWSSIERSNFALQVFASRSRITLLGEISCSTHLTIEC